MALSDKLHSSTSPYYEESRNSYWATQAAAIGPACILAPTTTQDVSTAVKLLSASNCQFAVRSGGHNSWGASTIQGGVVIDLSALNEVTVSADQKSTRVGPGRRWQDVYQKLDTMELAIPGGRLGTVGVGGLILGGGISFFSPRTGFVCDNVLNYEVVLASGEIVDANATSHSTLFKALKGSSNNLGIVTAFTMKTFSQGKFYGGSIILHDTNADQIVSELYKIATTPDYDENAAIIQNLAWGEHEGQPNWIFYGFCTYTGVDKTPTIFEPFTNIHPQYVNSMRVSNLTDFTMELANYSPNGHKNALITTTIVPDEKMMHRIIELCQEAIPAISQQGVIGIRFALTFQPLPLKTTKWGEDLDENVLGLDAKENLLCKSLLKLCSSWSRTFSSKLRLTSCSGIDDVRMAPHQRL